VHSWFGVPAVLEEEEEDEVKKNYLIPVIDTEITIGSILQHLHEKQARNIIF
jgi:hypothetical protein